MRRNAKRTRPAARRPGFSAASRLVGREPLLADAARLEGALARLYRRLADGAEDGPEAPRWRQAARLSREVADGLTDLADAVADPPHNPRPTRVRVATLDPGDLAAAAAMAKALAGDRSAPPPVRDVAALAALEGRAVVAPLTRMFSLCPSPPIVAIWRSLAVRRRVLEGLGVGPGGPAACPDPPLRAAPKQARAERPVTGAPAPNGREWTTDGCVERLNRARRCGLARIEDGRAVFFSARAVPGGLNGIQAGDPVTLRVRRGPLGLAAVRVIPAPDPGPPAPVV